MNFGSVVVASPYLDFAPTSFVTGPPGAPGAKVERRRLSAAFIDQQQRTGGLWNREHMNESAPHTSARADGASCGTVPSA
jgi:hypothetical protein